MKTGMKSETIVSILQREKYLGEKYTPDQFWAAVAKYRAEHPYLPPLHPSSKDPSREAVCEVCLDLEFIHPLINQEEGINAGISVMYSNLPSFCSDFFAIPHIMGTVPWIVQNTNVTIFFEALKKNAINIKYHITSPQAYWDAKRDELKKIAESSGVPYNEKQLKNLRTKILRELNMNI